MTLESTQTVDGEPLFELEDVVVAADGGRILGGVSGVISDSGITVIAGPSGSGKSTLLRLLNRLEVPAAGHVLYRGNDLALLDPLAHRREVGMVFQRPVLFGGTVRDNLLVASPDLDESRAVAALGRAEIDAAFLDRDAASLSGGEAQRVCIARALVAGPSVLLLDEPTSALDARPRLALEQLARSLADSGMPLVWVTHDLGQMQRLASAVIVLVDGAAGYWGSLRGLAEAQSPQVRHFLQRDGRIGQPESGGDSDPG